MKFLADENLGTEVPKYLRELGFDIISISEIKPGSSDLNVLELANTEKSILITLDKDFGELVFNQGLVHGGVILLRLKSDSKTIRKRFWKIF